MLLLLALACGAPSKEVVEDLAACDCSAVDEDGDGFCPCCRSACVPVFPDRCTDCDCDGYTKDVDCDDDDSLRHPGATDYGLCSCTEVGIDDDCDGAADEDDASLVEICDGIDNDCDDVIDEECEG